MFAHSVGSCNGNVKFAQRCFLFFFCKEMVAKALTKIMDTTVTEGDVPLDLPELADPPDTVNNETSKVLISIAKPDCQNTLELELAFP